jgi:predicted phage baseplate assembly protein
MSCNGNCNGTASCTCGCCSGISVQTPAGEYNLPGLPAITYRTGTWATFKDSMLARLSSADYPALAYLKTRDDDDFSIALLDATAVVLDILTFYQERLANESYLRTATQLQSLTALSCLIGYQPVPGIAASTWLAFTLKAATGQPPNPATTAITIPAGTQVQSVAAQNQTPQTFETSADILAKPDWNTLAVQTGVPWKPPGSRGVYLSGTSTQLNLGDSLLILGANRENWNATGGSANDREQWDVVVINKLVVDNIRGLTFVGWDRRLTHNSFSGLWTTAKIFALRQKVGLFGSNAPNPNLFTLATNLHKTSIPDLINDGSVPFLWKNFKIQSSSRIDLATASPKIVVGSWFALTSGDQAELFKVRQTRSVSLAEFGLSAKTTELAGDFADPSIGTDFPLQDVGSKHAAEVWGQSDQLTIAEQPLDHPLYGTFLDLETLRPDLSDIQAVAVIGNAQKLTVNSGINPPLVFTPDGDNPTPLTLKPGDVVTILDPTNLPIAKNGAAQPWTGNSGSLDLRVIDASARTGTIYGASLTGFTLALATSSDPIVQEFALVGNIVAVTSPFPHTRIHLAKRLLNVYDRTSTGVNANLALATAGASVSEIMGSGSASRPNQQFSLRQTPLTFIQSPTPTGRLSTLQVTANQVTWQEVPSLYNQQPTAQVFATLNEPGGNTDVLFGDGVEGAMLPTGQNNIQANYRIGSGLAGNVGVGTITTLVDRPLGVSGVTNPMAATGGQDPQSIDDIRANAPLSVLTLGRAVSIVDYQNFSASFAGIAKAYAIWIPSGPGRGVFVTVAGAGGSALAAGNPTLGNLVTALQDYGNPLIPINAATFYETLFGIEAKLAYDPSYDSNAVEAAVLAALQTNYSFANRSFGQGVSSDEVAAFIQAVPGVVAVNVTQLTLGASSNAGDISAGNWSLTAYDNWLKGELVGGLPRLCSGSPTRICPYVPVANIGALPDAAEILVLDPNPDNVVLGAMS